MLGSNPGGRGGVRGGPAGADCAVAVGAGASRTTNGIMVAGLVRGTGGVASESYWRGLSLVHLSRSSCPGVGWISCRLLELSSVSLLSLTLSLSHARRQEGSGVWRQQAQWIC